MKTATVYLYREKPHRARRISNTGGNPLELHTLMENKVPKEGEFLVEFPQTNYWLELLEAAWGYMENRAGDFPCGDFPLNDALAFKEKLEAFMVWFRQHHEIWDTGRAIWTIGLQVKVGNFHEK
jgi:hypothetical protein